MGVLPLINTVGCKNVHIRCKASDVDYAANPFDAAEYVPDLDLAPLTDCIEKTCQAELGFHSSVSLVSFPVGAPGWSKDGGISFVAFAEAVGAVGVVIAT